MRSSKLPLLVSLYLLNAGIGTVVAVARKLPYLFGGPGDPATIAIDFPTKGTAMSPPLTAMFLLAALTLLVLRKDRWGMGTRTLGDAPNRRGEWQSLRR